MSRFTVSVPEDHSPANGSIDYGWDRVGGYFVIWFDKRGQPHRDADLSGQEMLDLVIKHGAVLPREHEECAAFDQPLFQNEMLSGVDGVASYAELHRTKRPQELELQRLFAKYYLSRDELVSYLIQLYDLDLEDARMVFSAEALKLLAHWREKDPFESQSEWFQTAFEWGVQLDEPESENA